MAAPGDTAIVSLATNSKDDETLVNAREPTFTNQERFNEQIDKALSTPLQRVVKKCFPEPLYSDIKPPMSREAWMRFLLTRLPILHWIWTYELPFLFKDIVAGVSVTLILVPQALAQGLLAGLDPVYGLYTSLVPVVMYSIFGTSKHLSIGTFPVVSLLVRNSINTVLAGKGLEYCSSVNNRLTVVVFDDINNVTCHDLKVNIAVSLAFTSGLFMVVMGIFKMGLINLLLSDLLMSGYTTATAILVIASQLPVVFGISMKIDPISALFPGLLSFPRTVIEVCRQIFQWPKYVNTATFVASLISFIIFIGLDLTNNKLLTRIKIPWCTYSKDKKCDTSKRIPFPLRIPIGMVLVIFSTAVSAGIDYEHRWNGTVVGTVATSLPPISLPRPEYMLASLPDAILIAIVTFVTSISAANLLAKKFDYTIDSSQELIAYGISNVIGSLFSSYSATGNISRSGFQANAEGKTQLASLVSSLVLCIILVSLVSLFRSLPQAVIGVIVCVGLLRLFRQFKDVVTFYRLSTPDLLAWLMVFIATVLLGVDLGLVVGLSFSLMIVIVRVALPYTAILGQVPGTEMFQNINDFEKINTIPGLLIFQFHAPLCIVSSYVFRRRLELAAQLDRRQWEKKNEGILKKLITKLSRFCEKDGSVVHNAEDTPSSSKDVSSTLHTIVVDCGTIGFFDAGGVNTLTQIVQDFSVAGIQVIFAAMTKKNRDMLERSGFFKKFGEEWLFPTIKDAVELAKGGTNLLQAKIKDIEDKKQDEVDKTREEVIEMSQIRQGAGETN